MQNKIDKFPAYRINSDGTIESRWQWGPYYIGMKKKDKWKIMPLRHNDSGYIPITLCDVTGKKRRTHLHRLLAEVFISPKPFPGAIVRHLDGNSRNNNLKNLAWGTYKDNEDDKIAHGTWNTRNGGARLTTIQVLEIRKKLSLGHTEKILSKEYGVSRPTITRIKNKKIWKNI